MVLSRLQQRSPLGVIESVRALPRVTGSWVAASSPETRVLHESLRLHEVGLEVRCKLPQLRCCARTATASAACACHHAWSEVLHVIRP